MVLLAKRDSEKAYLDRWRKVPVTRVDPNGIIGSCRGRKDIGNGMPVTRLLRHVCERCGQNLTYRISVHRMQAITDLPREETWRGAVLRRNTSTMTGRRQFIEEASAICNLFQGENHCQGDHVLLETYRQNAVRRSHHSGRRGCLGCIPRCIGPTVVYHWTSHDFSELEPRACEDEATGRKRDKRERKRVHSVERDKRGRELVPLKGNCCVCNKGIPTRSYTSQRMSYKHDDGRLFCKKCAETSGEKWPGWCWKCGASDASEWHVMKKKRGEGVVGELCGICYIQYHNKKGEAKKRWMEESVSEQEFGT